MSRSHIRQRSSTNTVKPPPPNDPTISPIENTLELTPLSELGPNVFTNTRPQWHPPGARGIYGGSVIAQCLLAAQKTVPPKFVPHSMHCYFVLNGNAHIPIIYHVDIVREGRSFHTRTVQAKQRGQVIFTTTCSFTIPLSTKYAEQRSDGDDYGLQNVVRHRPVFPSGIRSPEECESGLAVVERQLKAGVIDDLLAAAKRERYAEDPLEWRMIGLFNRNTGRQVTLEEFVKLPPAEKIVRQWVRSKSPVVDDIMHNPGLSYLSDSWFIGTVGRVNRTASRDKVGMMVSLDHTIHFHAGERTKLNDWLLVETESPWAGEERGLARMKIWAKNGTLLATCLQEGMVRLKDGREGEITEAAAVSVPSSKL